MSEVMLTDRLEELAKEYANAKTPRAREKARRAIAAEEYKLEEDRERKRMDRLSKDRGVEIVHVEVGDDDEDEGSPEWHSDQGKGEEVVIVAVAKTFYMMCIANARSKLEKFDKKLLPVFDLVIKNGTNCDESIWELAVRDKNGLEEAGKRYSRNLKKILNFFSAQ